MSVFFAVQTIIEIVAVLLLIWGFANEEKFVAFEDKLARAIAINIRNRRRRKAAMERCRQQAQRAARQTAQCTPEYTQAPCPVPVPVKRQSKASTVKVA
jgi:hypothetical protein